MYRKINEVSDLVGITPSAIRKYEQKGILTPRRDEENDYRLYDVYDIATLVRARMYKQMGFSVSEAADMLNDMDVGDCAARIEAQKAKIAREILFKQRVLTAMDTWRMELEEIGNPPRVAYSPAMYFCEYFRDLRMVDDPDTIERARALIGYVPVACPGFWVDKEIAEGAQAHSSGGLLAYEADAAMLLGPALSRARFFPRRLCVTCTFEQNRSEPLRARHLEAALAFMREKGFTLTGDIWGKFVVSSHNASSYSFYDMVWLPIDCCP